MKFIKRIWRYMVDFYREWVGTTIVILCIMLPGCFGEQSTKSLTRDDRGAEKMKAALDSKMEQPSPLIGGDVDTGGGALTIGKDTPRTTEDKVLDVEQSSFWDMSLSEVWKTYSGWFFILFGLGFLMTVCGIGLLLFIIWRAWKAAKTTSLGQGIGYGVGAITDVLGVVKNITKHADKTTAQWVEADRLEQVLIGKLDTLKALKK